jgi:hypothetical protein
MRFPSQDRFLQYGASRRGTYFRTLRERGDGRGFFSLWKSEWDSATRSLAIDGLTPGQTRAMARAARWLLLQDLVQLVRDVAPDFPQVPPNVVAALPGALHQVRSVRSMLIAGAVGSGREQLAILLHVLSGRTGVLLRISGAEIGRDAGFDCARDMPEHGSVLIAEIEAIRPEGQAELAHFLAGDGRPRDIFTFSTTSVEPRELGARWGVAREVLMRTGQAEVRLPAPDATEAYAHFDDVVFDLAAVDNQRLPALREEAQAIASTSGGPAAAGRNPFEEALSWVLWREKARLATAMLADPAWERLRASAPSDDTRALRARLAAAFAGRTETHGPKAPVAVATGAAARAGVHRKPGVTPGTPSAPSPAVAPVAAVAASAAAAEDAQAAPARAQETDTCAPPVAVPTSIERDELLRLYYVALLEEEGGDLRRVATRAGRRVRPLAEELARLGVRVPRSAALTPASRTG